MTFRHATLNARRLLLPPLLVVVMILLCGASAWRAPAPGNPPPEPQATQDAALEPLSPDIDTLIDCQPPACRLFYLPGIARAGIATVSALDRAAAQSLYEQEYLPSEDVAAGWTGERSSCTPGTTSQSFRDAVLRRVNYFRRMAGVPALQGFSADENRQAQAAALMMSVNNNLDHTPPSTWACYSTDGSEGAGSSDLYLGSYGPDAITGYIFDFGAGNTAAGHRRWILHPPTKTMGTGDVPPDSGSASNALYVFDDSIWDDRPATRDNFVAWPPQGYVPYLVVNARWSFAYPKADFSRAQVSVQQDGAPVALTRFTPVNGYGENTLVWQLDGLSDYAAMRRPAADTKFTVTVSGVVVGGVEKRFTYDVIVFDPGT